MEVTFVCVQRRNKYENKLISFVCCYEPMLNDCILTSHNWGRSSDGRALA
jgi:hypothetical protein